MRNIYNVPSVSVLVSSEALMRVSFVLVKKVFPLFSCSGPARLIHHYLSFFITLDGEKLSADFDFINEVQFKVLRYLNIYYMPMPYRTGLKKMYNSVKGGWGYIHFFLLYFLSRLI